MGNARYWIVRVDAFPVSSGGELEVRQRGTVYSIGHSNHSLDVFLDLLARHRIEVLVDVRSQPYSKYALHFDLHTLAAALAERTLKYLYLGKELGGRPSGDEYYDDAGHVLYYRLARSPLFLAGLVRLERGAHQFRVAMMCSEEDPTGCHRHLLIGRVLNSRSTPVEHIRGDGSVQTADELAGPQMALFADLEESAWRSIRSVLPRGAPPTSSERSAE